MRPFDNVRGIYSEAESHEDAELAVRHGEADILRLSGNSSYPRDSDAEVGQYLSSSLPAPETKADHFPLSLPDLREAQAGSLRASPRDLTQTNVEDKCFPSNSPDERLAETQSVPTTSCDVRSEAEAENLPSGPPEMPEVQREAESLLTSSADEPEADAAVGCLPTCSPNLPDADTKEDTLPPGPANLPDADESPSSPNLPSADAEAECLPLSAPDETAAEAEILHSPEDAAEIPDQSELHPNSPGELLPEEAV